AMARNTGSKTDRIGAMGMESSRPSGPRPILATLIAGLLHVLDCEQSTVDRCGAASAGRWPVVRLGPVGVVEAVAVVVPIVGAAAVAGLGCAGFGDLMLDVGVGDVGQVQRGRG